MTVQEVKLSEIAIISVGYQARGRVEQFSAGDYSIIRPQDFDNNGNLNLNAIVPFLPSSKIDPSKSLVTINDVLVQARGVNHNAYIIRQELENTVASNSFYIVRLKKNAKILPGFLSWWLNQSVAQAFFEQESGVSTIPFISKSTLANTFIQVPPMEIQDRISNLVELRQKEQELSEKLSDLKNLFIDTVCLKATQN